MIMDSNPPMSSPPSILVCDFNHSTYDRRRSSASKSAVRNLSFRSLSSSPRPMAIPNAKEPLAPPPLPPPRYIEDLAIGHDSGWKWGNSFEEGEFGKPTLPPIKASSSLVGGGHSRPELVRRTERVSFDKDSKRGNAMSTAKVSLGLKNRSSFSTSRDTFFPSSSASSLPSPRSVYLSLCLFSTFAKNTFLSHILIHPITRLFSIAFAFDGRMVICALWSCRILAKISAMQYSMLICTYNYLRLDCKGKNRYPRRV